jgi:hypothetical protein
MIPREISDLQGPVQNGVSAKQHGDLKQSRMSSDQTLTKIQWGIEAQMQLMQ